MPKSVVVECAADGWKACENLTPPFAVKGMSRDVLHKSDKGAVRLNLTTTTKLLQPLPRLKQLSVPIRITLMVI